MATDMTDLTAEVRATIRATGQRALDNSTPEDKLNVVADLDFTFGTGASKCDQMFHDDRSLGAGASEDLDLAGSLTNAFGQTVTFADVKAIYIENTSDDSGTTITVGNAASNQFTGPLGAAAHTLTIPQGGFILLAADLADVWTVTAGTGDLLKVLNDDGANTATYKIVLLGESA